MARNTIGMLGMGLFLTGLYLVYQTFSTQGNIFFRSVGFIGGIILIIVEGKFLLDKYGK